MLMICDTIKIKATKVKGNDSGFVVINASDFDEKKHKKFIPPKPRKK